MDDASARVFGRRRGSDPRNPRVPGGRGSNAGGGQKCPACGKTEKDGALTVRSPGEAGARGGAEFSTEGRSGPGDGCHRGQSDRAGTMHLRLRGGAGVSGVVRETGGRGKVQLTMRECVETSAGSNPSRRAPRVARALFGRKTARGRGITCGTMRRDRRAGRSRPAREARGWAPRAPVAGRKAAPGKNETCQGAHRGGRRRAGGRRG